MTAPGFSRPDPSRVFPVFDAERKLDELTCTARRRRHGRQSGAHPLVILKTPVELARLHRRLRRIEFEAGAPGAREVAHPGA